MDRHERKRAQRVRRHRRVRKKVFGTPERPRLTVFRSQQHMYAQVIDDTAGRTLASASTLQADVREALGEAGTGGSAAAQIIGKRIAEKALAHGIRKVVFDRGGFKYHGRVQAVGEAAREHGLRF